MYSPHHHAVFVHIPKTAGTSMELFFTGHDWITQSPDDYAAYQAGQLRGGENPSYFLERLRVKHATQKELQDQLGPTTWNSSFRFTFVRNPWARLLSVYNHGLRESPGWTPGPFAAWLGQRMPLDHWNQPVFRQWVTDWDDLNFIGRFERLEQDFPRLLAALGLPRAPLPMVRHGSNGKHDPFAYDDTARRIIADRCGKEIERFNYRFEDAFPRPPVTPRTPRLSADWNAEYAVQTLWGLARNSRTRISSLIAP